MDTTNIVTIFIIALVCGFFILFFMSSNLLAVTQKDLMLPDNVIEITGEAVIPPPSGDGPYLYTIRLPLKIEHVGDWKYGASIQIAPLLTFKGVDMIPDIGMFSLSKGESKEIELRAIIESDIGPIQEQGAYYSGQMREHDSILLTTEDDGNFLVTIDDIHDAYPTKVRFSVECETDKQTIELVEWDFCKEGGKYSEQYEYCERYLDMCNGEIHIALMETAPLAQKRVNVVIIDAEGGKPFQPAEFVEVSLWRTGCDSDYDDFDELRRDCIDYFLGYAAIQEAQPEQ